MKFEPVVILDLVKYLFASLTALGIVTFDDATQQWVIGIVGAVLTLMSTVLTRSTVYAPATVERIRAGSPR